MINLAIPRNGDGLILYREFFVIRFHGCLYFGFHAEFVVTGCFHGCSYSGFQVAAFAHYFLLLPSLVGSCRFWSASRTPRWVPAHCPRDECSSEPRTLENLKLVHQVPVTALPPRSSTGPNLTGNYAGVDPGFVARTPAISPQEHIMRNWSLTLAR